MTEKYECDYETKINNANVSGYGGIVIQNTGSDIPEIENLNLSSSSIYPCSVGESDGVLLRNNFSYPLYVHAFVNIFNIYGMVMPKMQ